MQGITGAPAFASTSYTQTNPIDLTLDDDDSDSSSFCDRKSKRTCPSSRSFNAATGTLPSIDPTRFPPYHSGLSPAMSSSTLQPDNRPPPSVFPAQYNYPPMGNLPEVKPMAHSIQPTFTGPSNSAAFFQTALRHPQAIHTISRSPHLANGNMTGPPPHQHHASPPNFSQDSNPQVIDLTSSPSPPPMLNRPPHLVSPGSLPPDLPPKTPVCIGQLTVTALVLYPVNYLHPQSSSGIPDSEWAPVRMSYEHNAAGKPGNSETIHIRTPNTNSPSGEGTQGENFGVVEQKVATFLGPMLGKGLIRLDGKVRRGQPNVSFIQLVHRQCSHCFVAAYFASHPASVYS